MRRRAAAEEEEESIIIINRFGIREKRMIRKKDKKGGTLF